MGEGIRSKGLACFGLTYDRGFGTVLEWCRLEVSPPLEAKALGPPECNNNDAAGGRRRPRSTLSCERLVKGKTVNAPPTILGTGLTWRGMGIMGVTRENATEITIKTGIMYTASDSAPYNSSMPW
ncbi:hypothetical protein EDB19DRAFT_1834500 [Suillus lakei]|nr:hypothetical protein EDB19DRAFT_1834500 [Suillus lakei]